MSPRPKFVCLLACLLALLSLGAGCGMQVQNYTRQVPSRAITPNPEMATLVVVRRGGIGEMYTLFDANAQVLTQVGLNTFARISLPPGRHRIYAVPGRVTAFSSMVEVEAVAGRVYYASVPRLGFWAVAPRHQDRWPHRDEWLAATQPVELDAARLAQLELELPVATRREAIAAVEKNWPNLDARKREDFILHADDGVAP